MSTTYVELVLDPRCIKPASEVNDRFVYIDALAAIKQALNHPHITDSEKTVIEAIQDEVRKNRCN
jgi:hypothetical protein